MNILKKKTLKEKQGQTESCLSTATNLTRASEGLAPEGSGLKCILRFSSVYS